MKNYREAVRTGAHIEKEEGERYLAQLTTDEQNRQITQEEANHLRKVLTSRMVTKTRPG